MATTSTITGVQQTIANIQQQGIDYANNFNKEVSNRLRQLSQKMQIDMNNAIDRGPVPFTKNAILFRFYRDSTGQAVNQILVKNIQAQYLYDIIVKPSNLKKFIPTSTARMTQQGNISGLKSGLSSGKYKVVDSGGKRRLIDTSKKDTKTKTKRVIGLRETKKRKLVYDFYKEAEQGVRLVLSGVQGHFRISRM
ncbi:hypothetical protein [Serratia marcescens]|uniref:hypothetical protein n=1 Tax=Serratia marcescens TaxID=615 RepID=UPI003B246D71